MSWPSFIENGKISLRFLLPISIVCGCFLFLPQEYKAALQIQKISDKYATYIGPTFLISTILILIDGFVYIYKLIVSKYRTIKINGYVKGFLSKLDPSEKSLIREFYITHQDTMSLPINNPTVIGLTSKRILIQVGSTGKFERFQPCFSYCLTEVAKKFITNELIDLPNNPTDSDIKFLENNRPRW